MIYLFSSIPLGEGFIETATSLAQRHDGKLVVIFSAKGSDHSWLRKMYREFRLYLRLGGRVRFVKDVNAPAFRKRIRPGDHGIIAGFGQIFREETIQAFETFVNLHASVLPLYRGPVPSYWCIKNGEKRTGFTIHRVTKEIDRGEILYQQAVEIGDIDDPKILTRKILQSASDVFAKYLVYLLEGGEWERKEVDAFELYETHVDYLSFPE